jgi:hypothetical protein
VADPENLIKRGAHPRKRERDHQISNNQKKKKKEKKKFCHFRYQILNFTNIILKILGGKGTAAPS